MLLVKYCKSEHNITKGSKLLLGNLFKYRDIENQELLDDEEGKYTFRLTISDGVDLDQNFANLLFQGQIAFGDTSKTPRFPGSFSTFVKKLNIQSIGEDSLKVSEAEVDIEMSVTNCYVFCMTLAENADQNPFENYDDYWTIHKTQATQFGINLANLIRRQLKVLSVSEAIAERHSLVTLPHVAIDVRHQKVIYRDRDIHITPENLISYDELIRIFREVVFVKPLDYQNEREYRFIFDFRFENEIYPVKKQDQFLDLNALLFGLA